jgi:hypothetical protein
VFIITEVKIVFFKQVYNERQSNLLRPTAMESPLRVLQRRFWGGLVMQGGATGTDGGCA